MSTYFKEDICQDKRETLESDSGTSLFLQSEPTYFMLKSKCQSVDKVATLVKFMAYAINFNAGG